jgi:aminoglycoside/choline kinase family phosphotransferase
VKFQTDGSEREAHIYRVLSERPGLAVPRLFATFENGGLIIEDIAPARRRSLMEGCTVVEVRAVLARIASVHAQFRCLEGLPTRPPEHFASVIDLNMKQCWQTFRERYEPMLIGAAETFEWTWRNALAVSKHRQSGPATLYHGDLGPENLLFPLAGGGPVLVDWQLAGRGPGAVDVADLLVRSLPAALRRANEHELLEHYFDLTSAHVPAGYSFDRLMLDYRACVTRSVLTAVMLVGPRFADRPDQPEVADVVAERVIAAVQDLDPAGAFASIAKKG